MLLTTRSSRPLNAAAELDRYAELVMAEHWLRTNEQEEAVSSLEATSDWVRRVERDVDFWRWVVLALHNSTQGFMVLALRGSDGLLPLRDKIASQWVEAYRTDGKYPEEKLDSFLNLYKKIQSDRILFFVHSAKFVPTGTQDRNVRKLNALRNDFIHFLPRSWFLEVSGLPRLCLDCIEVVRFLGWECGNVLWHEEPRQDRALAALERARIGLELMEKRYATSSA